MKTYVLAGIALTLALAGTHTARGGDNDKINKANALNNRALDLFNAGKGAEAVKVGEEAVALLKEALGERHPGYATALNNLAAFHRSLGNYAKAEPLYRQALAIRKEVLGEKHADYTVSLNSLALLYKSKGDYAKAEPLYRQAMETRREVLGPKHPAYATSLSNLVLLYVAQGNPEKAEPLYRQAMEINRVALGEKHPAYALNLQNLAALFYVQGDLARAETLNRQALAIKKEVLGEKHPDYALSLNNLAVVCETQGNYAEAERLYRQALGLFKDLVGTRHPAYATGLNNLAELYKAQQKHALAEPLYLQALEIRKQVLGEKHPDHAESLNNLAALYHAQEKYAKAEPHYRQALEIFEERLGKNHFQAAVTLNNLAHLYDDQGKYAEAEPLYRRALLAAQRTQEAVRFVDLTAADLRTHLETAFTLESHGLLMQKRARGGGSAELLRVVDRSFFMAMTVLERVRRENLGQQESKIKLGADTFRLYSRRMAVLDSLCALENKTEDFEQAFWTAEQGTARAFLEAMGKSRVNLLAQVSAALQNKENQLLHDLRLIDLRLDKESAQALEQQDRTLIGELLEERRAADGRLRDVIVQMEKEYPQYAGLKYPRPCKLDDARACLAPDEVALLFVPGAEASFIVLVEAKAQPVDRANGLAIIKLPAAAELAEHVATLNDRETLGLPARAKALGREAFDAVLGPCKDRIDGKHLVLVPNDAFCLLPFEMLVEEDGKYLIEKHRIRYAPSLTALHLIHLWKEKRAQPVEPLFAVGDPVYEKEGFGRLVHSGEEVADIARILGATADHVLTGAQASEAKVKAASAADRLAKARYVHFATHGILGVDKGKQPALVLNLVGNTGEERMDGFLEYDEILNLKMNADLVVLSACRTGQGKMASGEGVTGLARAFLYAGSKGVVCSLWSVDDRETANLMVDLYRHLQKGRPAADALRDAQLAMIRAGKAPLYWAPFILIGE